MITLFMAGHHLVILVIVLQKKRKGVVRCSYPHNDAFSKLGSKDWRLSHPNKGSRNWRLGIPNL
jgi:hypothetical protein